MFSLRDDSVTHERRDTMSALGSVFGDRLRQKGTLMGARILLCVILILSLSPGWLNADDDRKAVIVRCSKPYDRVVAAVRNLGGEVTSQYENVDAIAANVPADRLAELMAVPGVQAVVKDVIVNIPRPIETVGGKLEKGLVAEPVGTEAVNVLSEVDLSGLTHSLPENYNFNNNLTGAASLHAQGKLGQEVIVGVIDTGTANAPVVPALSGTVIGGENFVTADPVQSSTSRRNDPHGTWVGSMIAAHVIFGFSNTSSLVRSLKIHTPESVLAPCPNPPAVAVCGVPMIGTAPASKIYALKIFDSRGGGSPESRVIAAMDRAITLRRNFNNGVPSVPVSGNGTEENPFKFDSLNIQVVNMSLGGPTLFAGRDVEDELTIEMLKVGITIVASAGNDGFPAMTGSSPGSGIGTLTAGAASTSVHERVLRDVQFGVGVGALFRPTTHHQTAFFSARGPTADGRLDPDAVANGFASFAQGSCLGFAPGANRNACIAGLILGPINLVSGTSFSSPTTAGAAALLRHEVPAASPAQIRNSLIGSANPTVLGDGSGPIDQGSGFINLPAALGLLAAGNVSSNVLPKEGPDESVRENIAELGFRTIQFSDDRFSTRVENLRPGQVAQFFVRSRKDTDRLVVTLRNITPELAPSQQNVLFGDDIFFQVADAPTSFNRQRVPPSQQFVSTDQTVVVDNPQSGLVRVALQGDWTNAGRISADLVIKQHRSPLLPETAEGKVAQGQVVPIQIDVPTGRAQVVFELFWERDWASYPTSDIDLILLDPNGKLNFNGATLDSPERVVVNNPTSGTWTAFIIGFTVNGREEEFVLRAAADGIRLRAHKHKD